MVSNNELAPKKSLTFLALAVAVWPMPGFAQEPQITIEFSQKMATAYFQQDSTGLLRPVTADGVPYKLCSGLEGNPCNLGTANTFGHHHLDGGEPNGVCSTITVYINGRPHTYADPNDPDCA